MTLKPPSWKKLFCNFDVVLLNQVGVKNRITLVSPGLKEWQCLHQTFQVEVWEALEAFQVQMVDRCSSVEVRYPLEGDHWTLVEGHYPSVEGRHCPKVGDHD